MRHKIKRLKAGFIVFVAAVVAAQEPIYAQQTTTTPSTSSTTPSTTSSTTTSSSGTSSTSGTTTTSSTTTTTSSQSTDQSGDTGVISPAGSPGSGILNYQADLFTGRFTYSVPIQVVPGRQGAQPKLTLGYNSAAGNGWCGVGWTLDTGFIQRDTRKGVPISWAQAYIVTPGGFGTPPTTNYLDYNLPLSQYDDSKGFVADIAGAMSTLVRVSGTNQNPIVYRQQVDTAFLTYNYYTNDNHWEVIDKNGNTFYFGEGPANQMENPRSGWITNSGSSTFRWALDRVVDANGNETFLNYTTDGGMLYLTNIMYNANTNSPALAASAEVDFILTNRPDTNITFQSGYRVQADKLLSEIDVKVSGNNVRKYVLGYTQSPSTLRSLLTSVTEYGSDYTTALPPLTFGYQVKPFTFEPDMVWTNIDSEGKPSQYLNSIRYVPGGNTSVEMRDMDGDGLPDRVMSQLSTNIPYTNFVVQFNTGAGFGPDEGWGPLNSQGITNYDWNCPTAVNTTEGAYPVDLLDLNGDGLPDRVMREYPSPYTNFWVQINNGLASTTNGCTPATLWTNVDDYEISGDGNKDWLSVRYKYAVDLIDMNGDGLPDRVSRKKNSQFDSFKVQLNTGNGFARADIWSPLDSQGQTDASWNQLSSVDGNNNLRVVLMDINGDGLPDRVMLSLESVTNIVATTNVFLGQTTVTYTTNVFEPYTNFVVQLNNGAGFEPDEDWGPLDVQGLQGDKDWGSPIGTDGSSVRATLVDINGDGLPDRVMRVYNQPYTNWVVQLNTGSGFAPPVIWGPLDSQGKTGSGWNDISSKSSGATFVDFFDINGDGLPDRVMRSGSAPYDHFVVQLNQGPFPDLLNVVSNGLGGSIQVSYTASTTLNNRDKDFTNDPWSEGAKSLLPFNVWVVSQIVTSDGLQHYPLSVAAVSLANSGQNYQVGDILKIAGGAGTLAQIQVDRVGHPGNIQGYTLLSGGQYTSPPPSPNSPTGGLGTGATFNLTMTDPTGNVSTYTYSFKGGYYNATEKEFRGFSQCTVTDPLGTKTTTYFHQSGGRDNSALGEYKDQGSEAKKGIPFRIDVVGNDDLTNKIILNKVEEVEMNSNGWYFPFIGQTIVMDYEGLPNYRAVAKQFVYDTNTENLIESVNLGEVTDVVVNGQTFTDVGNDSIYSWITYTNIGSILDKPSDVKNTSDTQGQDVLRETQMAYDSHGRLTSSQVWLDTSNTFIPVGSDVYDQYGNLVQSTDAAGIVTTTTYDSTYEQYPVSVTTGPFTSSTTFDIRSGSTVTSTDIKGLVTSNAYDVFFRPTAAYISTNAYGPPVLWQGSTYYSLGGISNGISYNYVLSLVNDDVNPNGYETLSYSDGLGRAIESRAEAENGQFRVANTLYDPRGKPYYQTLPYFSSGTGYTPLDGTYLGALTEYDDIGRSFRVTPAEQAVFSSGQLLSMTATGGDTDSPEGPSTTAFVDGNNPWATVVTDSEGKVKKSYRDAYGRTIQITEVTSNGDYNTTYAYDLLGNPTNVTDSAGNSTVMQYDSLGRKTSMTDPDMGTWIYAYDNAGRMIQQTSARGDVLKFYYDDPLGRLTSKQIYNSNAQLTGTVTYTYDQSDDTNYTVYPGQLYKVTDLQGYEKYSYDVRGRVLKSDRYLSINSMQYVTQATYDDADRVQTLTYPGNSAVIQYSYDTAGNLSQIKSLSGTGPDEVFYTPMGFNDLGQLMGCVNGNGVVTTNIYYPNSKRLEQTIVSKGTNILQNLSYTYDSVSDIKSVNDGVYTNAASATISGITYDDLYRVTSVTSAAQGLKTYAYNPIGNILTNQDFGPGAYVYGSSKPHAVTSANGVNYTYDACGNMKTRGNQTLTYDPQNQLVEVSTTNDTVRFGYDDSGERLWRCGTNGYTIWINGIYEIHNGKVLCHVVGDNGLIATFEPYCDAGLAKVFGEKNWYLATTTTQKILAWPFEKGRAQWSMLGGTWVAVFGVCLMAGRKVGRASRLPKRGRSSRLFRTSLWRQLVTLLSISAFLWGSTPQVQAAPTYNPVFYYYYTNSLGSSNVLTDRSGELVQHFEYGTFGQTTYTANSSAFPMSNLYTGQIYDSETGLYYYGARYYDPQLGRFIQPDSIVQSPSDPQTLNRYSYCGNNPLNYTDPSGNIFGIDDVVVSFLIYCAIGAGVSAGIAAITGGNIMEAAIGGALAAGLLAMGIGAAGAIATHLGMVGAAAKPIIAVGGALGGAAGGAAASTVERGNVGMGALIGAIAGGVVGYLDPPKGVPDNAVLGEKSNGVWAWHWVDTDSNGVIQIHAAIVSPPSSAITLSPGEASAAGGAATAASTAAANTSIGEPSTWVSMIPFIGNALEFAHFASNGQWGWATVYAAATVLDFTGIGEVGDLAIKGGLKVAEKVTEEEGTTFLYQKIGAAGEHLKFGITKNPATRYTAAELNGGRLKILARGNRADMLELERNLHETLPLGPEERQSFYIQKQLDKGLSP